jgi:hypothetical protein
VRKDVDRLQGELKVIGDDAAKKRAEIEANSKTALAAKDVEIASARKATDDVKKKLTDMQIKSLNDLTEKDIQIDKLKVTIAELNRKLIALNSTGALVKTATGLPSKLPDGSVAQVFPDMNLVYLRLTRPQQAKLGMRYVIFSKDKPVPDTGEGKAVVEISSLEGGSIQGKIIKSTASDPMVPGDPALNLVVGPRKYSFVVYGNFDLRNDGVFEPSGKSQIEGLITRWGGTVQQDMDMTTNFLILGVQTEVPPKPAENADAVTRENYEKKLDENKKWAELYDRAARQTIPAMNTNTFLHFIGFFNDDLGPGWEKRVRPGDDYLPSK